MEFAHLRNLVSLLISSLRPLQNFVMVQMTVEAINFCIKRKELIRNPQLNEKLYLSNQGFSEIASLERFPQVNALFLSRNSIYKITNLESLRYLRHLTLSDNKIGELS